MRDLEACGPFCDWDDNNICRRCGAVRGWTSAAYEGLTHVTKDGLVDVGGMVPPPRPRQIKSMLGIGVLKERFQFLHRDGDLYAVRRRPYITYETADLEWLIYFKRAWRVNNRFTVDSVLAINAGSKCGEVAE